MQKFDLLELGKRTKADTEKKRSQMKVRYRYARDMGFSAAESVILQTRSEELIKELADERMKGATHVR